jgi:hypothetical protein
MLPACYRCFHYALAREGLMPVTIRRRELIATIWGAAVVWSLAVRAQQPGRVFKIGHLESGWPSSSPKLLAAFQQGLRELSYPMAICWGAGVRHAVG